MTPPPRRHLLPAVALLALLALLAACSRSDDTLGAAVPAARSSASVQPVEPTATAEPVEPVELTVLAAASLTEVFTALGEQFEAANAGTTVTFSFGPSTGLAQQVLDGAPADVIATASVATMKTVIDGGGAAGEPVTFARNRLQLVVPAGNPGKVTGLADLAREELKIALCAEKVPCGSAAMKVLKAAGVTAEPDTLEPDVKAVLGKVTLGEVDAALVYRTDVLAAGDAVVGIDAGETEGVTTAYPIAVLEASEHAEVAQAFVDLVLGATGVAALEQAGFDRP